MVADKKIAPGTYVYGLDIGTRSIVGTVGYRQKDRFVVVAQYTKEHESRAMIDGQIHDINAVSETIREVTEILAERTHVPLKQVCIAAAGRVLKTVTIHVDMDLDVEKLITKEDIFALDSLGIEKAYEAFQKSSDYDQNMKFYCVGYSVMHYFMNGYPMNQLENHKAKEISADLIATFLPDDVVDGLYKAVELAGLEVANLTLEPIAAIQLAIPDMYRMLNIALIDVGAGTSDISITKDGSIIAYGMLPVAGDCLTEDIARHCLVDFKTAEMIKRGISDKDCVEYKDIMGIPQKITKDEVLSVVSEDLENMAKLAADKIKELNGNKPVSAVFVVGGGGKIDTYTDRVAKHLGIMPERCAVRGEEVMTKIDFMEKDALKDSLFVTPIGICLNYYEQSNNFIFVTFNDKRIKLYDNNHLAIVDAAILAEFPNEDLFPKRGENLEFTLNEKPVCIRGKRGESAMVWLNDQEADIHASIRSNDVIRLEPSTAGEKAQMAVSKLPEYNGNITVRFEDKELVLPKLANVNGKLQSAYYEIQNGDVIELMDYYTVLQILEFMDIDPDTVHNVMVNNELADQNTKVYNNFTVALKMTADTDLLSEENTKEEDYEEPVLTETAKIENESIEPSDQEDTNSAVVEQKSMSAIERAKADAQKMVEKLQFEHAEESLMAMIQSAVSMQNSGQNSVKEASYPKSTHLKIEKSAKELYGNIQSNLNRIKSGESITDIRSEAIEKEGGIKETGRIISNTVSIPKESDEKKDVPKKEPEKEPEKVRPHIPPAKSETVNGKITQTIHVVVNDKLVTLTGKPDYIYVDVFEFYEFDLSRPQGKAVETLINGRDAQYTEPLSNGDELQIFWRD